MKRSHAVLLPVLVLAASFTIYHSHAQSANPNRPQAGGYTVTEIGPDYAVHQKTVLDHGTNRVLKYVQVESGLNFTNQYGQLTESKEFIEVLPSGMAQAVQGRHHASFPGDISQGVITVTTPDGLNLKSRPLGLSLTDGTNLVLFAELQSSAGVVVGSNVVIYADAFTTSNGFRADLRYIYKKS